MCKKLKTNQDLFKRAVLLAKTFCLIGRFNGKRPSIFDVHVFVMVCFVSVVNTCQGKRNLLSVLGEKQ